MFCCFISGRGRDPHTYEPPGHPGRRTEEGVHSKPGVEFMNLWGIPIGNWIYLARPNLQVICATLAMNKSGGVAVAGLPLLGSILVLLLLSSGMVRADYENTWNFYYEQPCCGGSSSGGAQHHLRHHRGKLVIGSSEKKFIGLSRLFVCFKV